ncbi:hypothetical protein RR48_07947 [Papilio machaon]|uniref:Uncharacterized protein n=1 Tax=Papilio machaon TaxID=76193 RepID=A0A194QQ57_PAPMA|nr:hypothetical protein RR48_07947 [Papilio machaon]
MSDECQNRKHGKHYIDNSDIVIKKLKKQARRYRVVESRYNAKESILGNPCLDIEWHTAPLTKQKLTKEPDGTLIPRLAAAVEAEVEISKQLAQCGQREYPSPHKLLSQSGGERRCVWSRTFLKPSSLSRDSIQNQKIVKDRGPEFCASHCPAFLTPVKESGFYAQKRKLIEKYIKDTKLEKKMQRLLNLKTHDAMIPKSASKRAAQKKIEDFPEIIIPKTVVLPRSVARRKKLTEKEEVEELEEILGIESRKEGQPELLLRSDSLSSTKARPDSSRTSAITPKRGAEPGRRPSCDSETIQPTESELDRAYNKIRTFKLKHLCEEDPMPSFLPTKRMVELKPRPKSNRKQECEADPAEIAEREKECDDDPKRPFKPEVKQVSSLYESKTKRTSESELLSEPKKKLQDEPKRISEPELRRIFEPRGMSLDDLRLTTGTQLKQTFEPKRKPENESGIKADIRITSDLETKQLIELKSEDYPKPYPCKTKSTSGHAFGQTSEPKIMADNEPKPTSQHEQTHDLESKQAYEAANASNSGEINKRESKRTAEREPIPKNVSKRIFGYRRTAKKEPKSICDPKLSSEVKSEGISEPEPRTSENYSFRKLFETKRHTSKTKQISEDERKSVLEVKKTHGNEPKQEPESKRKSIGESRRVKEHRRTAKDASKYTSRGEMKQTSDTRRTPELGSRQTSELRQPCGAIAIANLASAHPSRTSMPSRMSAGSGHSKRSVKSDKNSVDENEDKGSNRSKRSDSARTASAASSRVASANQLNKPCTCFENDK